MICKLCGKPMILVAEGVLVHEDELVSLLSPKAAAHAA